NIRFFVDHGTIGLYNQGDAWCPVGDFVGLRNWLISKIMWNPSLDENTLVREFLEGYYGKAATPFLMEYFDVIIDRAEASGKRIYCKQYSTDFWLDYESVCKATEVFNQAIAAAKEENEEFVQRLRRERLPLEHVWLRGYAQFKSEAESKGEAFLGPANPVDAHANFFAMCKKYNVVAYSEGSTPKMFADFKENMLHRFKLSPIPDEFKNNEMNVYDFQEYDFNVN